MPQFKLNQSVRLFSLLIVVVVGVNIAVLLSTRFDAEENEGWVTHTYEVIELVQKLLLAIQNAETGQRGYLLTNNSDYLEPYYLGTNQASISLTALIKKTSDNPEQQENLKEIQRLVDDKFAELDQTIQLASNGEMNQAIALVNSNIGKELMGAIRTKIAEFSAIEHELLILRKSLYESAKFQALIITFSVTLLLLIILLTYAAYMRSRIISPLMELTSKAKLYERGDTVTFRKSSGSSELSILENTLRIMVTKIELNIRQLQQEKESAQQRAKVKTDFLSNMSHEIRTPMNGVYGSLELLKGEVSAEKRKSLIENATISARLLITIINDILDFSKIEAGKLHIEKAPFKLSSLLEYILSDLSVNAHAKGLGFRISREANHDYWCGDVLRIKQVLINIISNSIKFTHEGKIEIKVSYAESEGKLNFSVDDTGIGMSENELSRLFERFEQADKSTTKKYGGTGLGMSITHSLVEMMDGEIIVISKPGAGTKFQISLPIEKSEEFTEQTAITSLEGLDLSAKTILVAEDNVINTVIIKEILLPTKAKLEFVTNGKEAVEMADAINPCLILMDIQMPVMDGIEACRLIKSAEPKVPIIALTANVMEEDKELYMQSGFDDFLGKPINLAEVCSALAKYKESFVDQL